MTTRSIKPSEWSHFLEGFSKKHDGWLVTIESLEPEFGDQVEGENLPLRGLTYESDGDCIEISLIRGERHLSHTIDHPKALWLKQSQQGADQVLEIEAADGNTLVLFRSPMRPDEVDDR